MNKIVIVSVIFLALLLLGISFYVPTTNNQMEENEPKRFPGPVRPGDDEEYYRQTGITRPLVEE